MRRGVAPPPEPGRPGAHWSDAKQGAGPRARGRGSGRFQSGESGLGFHRASPAIAAAAYPEICPRCTRAAPSRQRLRKVAERGRPSSREVVGLRAGSGLEEACLRSLDPGALRPRVQRPVGCAAARERAVKLQPPQRSLVAQASRLPKRAQSGAAEPSRASGRGLGAGRRPRGGEPPAAAGCSASALGCREGA